MSDTTPVSPPPTDTEWQSYCRWAIPPLGSRRHMWIRSEAQEIVLKRTGKFISPALEDYEEANRRIPADYQQRKRNDS